MHLIVHLRRAATGFVVLAALWAAGPHGVDAAELREFTVEGQTARIAPMADRCFLDRDDSLHGPAWLLVDRLLGRSGVFAVVSECGSVERGDFDRMVAVYALDDTIGVGRRETSELATVLADNVEVLLTDYDRFVPDTYNMFRLRTPRNESIGGIIKDGTLIQIVETETRSGRAMFVAGTIPIYTGRGKTTLLQTYSFSATDPSLVSLQVSMHDEVLQNIRRNNRTITLRHSR